MTDTRSLLPLPSLAEAREALAQLATNNAVEHLDAALVSLRNLADALQNGTRLSPQEQRLLERDLLRFRVELRHADTLANQGLAYCREWADLLLPPPTYQANGATAAPAADRPSLSLSA